MDLLIAEDLLLLLLDDEKGDVATGTPVDTALGGALLVELALHRGVDVEPASGRWRRASVTPSDDASDADPVLADPVLADPVLTDPVLAEALQTIAAKPRSAQDLVDRLGKGTRERLSERLVERGILERRESKMLGLFPRTRWPARDSSHEDAVRRGLESAVLRGERPDERTASLVALLSAIDRVPAVVSHPDTPTKEVKRRGREIADGVEQGAWAATAVKDAIAAAMAATTAATVAATSAATTAAIN